jgi:hypothetical protein
MTPARVMTILGTAMGCFVTMSALHPATSLADDPLDGIKSWVQSERLGSKCQQLTYNPLLERDAEYYARNNSKITGNSNVGFESVSGYNGKTTAFGGTGDPKEKALENLAMDHNTIHEVWDCSFTEYGVGFYRYGEDDLLHNPTDYVTVVLGDPAPPPPPERTGPPIKHLGKLPPKPTPTAAPTPVAATPAAAATPKATVTADVDVYDAPNGTGNKLADLSLRTGSTYDVITPCAENWCHLAIPAAPGGSGWVYQDGFLSVTP